MSIEIRHDSGNASTAAPVYAQSREQLPVEGLGADFDAGAETIGATANAVRLWENSVPGGAPAVQATAGSKPTKNMTLFGAGLPGLAFDGGDHLLTSIVPTTSGFLAAAFRVEIDSTGQCILGSQAASNGRCALGINSTNKAAAGIGAQSFTTILGTTTLVDEGNYVTMVTWDGSTVKLYVNNVQEYSAAQSGAVNTTVAMMIGALSANGTAGTFWKGDGGRLAIGSSVPTSDERNAIYAALRATIGL